MESDTALSTDSKASNQILICKTAGCHDISVVDCYCRLHYLASWRKSKTKQAKKHGQKLEAYLKELGKKFPEEFLEKLRNDVEEMAQKGGDVDTDDRGTLFESGEGDEDFETIIKGIRVDDQ